MALFLPGKSRCLLCGTPVVSSEEAIMYPAFLPKGHSFWHFSDGIFHRECFARWEGHEELERLYRRFREIWATRPRDLRSREEIDAWGRKAFAEFRDKPE